MGRYRVIAVHTEPAADGEHDHISQLLAERKGKRYTVELDVAVQDISSPDGDRYFTDVDGARTDVVVVHCSDCDEPHYLRTHPDASTRNNLDNLPRY